MSLDDKAKEFIDLHVLLQTRLIYSKIAFDINANYSFIENLGKETLIQNMKYCKDVLKSPSFDPNNPYPVYNDKNKYFSATNELCQYSLWHFHLYGFAEQYYSVMLETIKKFEKENSYNHNKGIVYANLGISQAAQMKIDKGFANILKALDEDRGYIKDKPESAFFIYRLFRQTERLIVVGPLESQLKILKKDNEICPTAYTFLKSLEDPDQRIFFEYTFIKIMENYSVWQEKPNRFSANRMISSIQDMCLFAEDFLKKKGYIGMLKKLIDSAFSGIDLQGCGAESYEELNDKLEQFLNDRNKKERALQILLTLRNFSSHNISAGESSDFILQQFAEIFTEILRAIIHIHQLH